MKKLFLSLVAAIVAATATYAQNSLIAVLSHEGEVSTFYGAGALSEAHAAAVNGDVITLSSGTFTATNITKGITIRGAGMEMDEENKLAPTVITGAFEIGIRANENYVNNFLMEGVYCDNSITTHRLDKPTFIKCKIKSFGVNNSYTPKTYLKMATFLHCIILDNCRIFTGSCSNGGTATFINSVVNNPESPNNSSMPLEFINCLVRFGSRSPSEIHYSSFTNCIISNNTTSRLYEKATAYYCVGENTTNGINIFDFMTNSTNYSIENGQFNGLFKPDTFYELTDEAKEAYKGQDDTEVGIYGGNMPYDPFTTNPKITKYIVAGKSTADGKLSVDIEVKAAE